MQINTPHVCTQLENPEIEGEKTTLLNELPSLLGLENTFPSMAGLRILSLIASGSEDYFITEDNKDSVNKLLANPTQLTELLLAEARKIDTINDFRIFKETLENFHKKIPRDMLASTYKESEKIVKVKLDCIKARKKLIK